MKIIEIIFLIVMLIHLIIWIYLTVDAYKELKQSIERRDKKDG